MAIIIKGKSKCTICNNVIADCDDIIAFPAFIPSDHIFSQYSDAAYHSDCFASWEYGKELLALYEGYNAIYSQRPMPPENIQNFQEWYDNSEEIKIWEQKLNDYFNKNKKHTTCHST